ncbi:hypothetical protein [Hymenobacter antarcticus]|uniref:hypothetical protein n=1 Tax=Hymenobacter antarcticus TaxID=486270 RepID=UPI0031F052D1
MLRTVSQIAIAHPDSSLSQGTAPGGGAGGARLTWAPGRYEGLRAKWPVRVTSCGPIAISV